MTDEELRSWALAHPNMPQAVAVLRLLRERDARERATARVFDRVAGLVRRQAATVDKLRAFALAAAERVFLQHELLGRRAEKTPGIAVTDRAG